MQNNEIIASVWSEFIKDWDWDLYGHFTFRDYPHPEAANKIWMKVIHEINRKSYGSRYWKRKQTDGIIWIRGTEYQRRGAIHYHSLMGRVPSRIRRMDIVDRWFELG